MNYLDINYAPTTVNVEQIVKLTRDHLIRGREDKSFWEVEYYDFKVTQEQYNRSAFIVFVDDDHRARVLKDRHSLVTKIFKASYGINTNKLHPDQVYKIAVDEMEFSERQVKSKWRKEELVQTRAAICIVMRQMFNFGASRYFLSLREIGEYVGGVRHSTVLSYWKRHREELVVQNRVKRIQEKVNEKIRHDENQNNSKL